MAAHWLEGADVPRGGSGSGRRPGAGEAAGVEEGSGRARGQTIRGGRTVAGMPDGGEELDSSGEARQWLGAARQ